MNHDESLLLFTAREPKHMLSERIRALEELARIARPGLAPRLRELWTRLRHRESQKSEDWDPEAAERVVDLYVVYALHKSGDDSLLPHISERVAQAGTVLRGPFSELGNAAKVIRAIGRLDLVDQLVRLTAGPLPNVLANLVRTLQMLRLPSPPSGGPVDRFPELTVPVEFTIHRLSEELKAIADLSKGRIILSPGVIEFMTQRDFDRGEVHRKDITLADVLTQELDMLDVTYVVTPDRVVICTFQVAAERWRRVWPEYAPRLKWERERQAWNLQ